MIMMGREQAKVIREAKPMNRTPPISNAAKGISSRLLWRCVTQINRRRVKIEPPIRNLPVTAAQTDTTPNPTKP